MSGDGTDVPDVTIISADDCPLCDHALDAARDVATRLPFTLTVTKAQDGTPERLRVPIVLVDGRERMFGRVGAVLLEREIRAARKARRG